MGKKRPYQAIELDAKRKAQKIGAARNIHPGIVFWALSELWETAWREKRAELTELEVLGCVGGAQQVLVDDFCQTEFLDRLEDGRFRVRGADKYLAISAAQSAAGKAHSDNLRKGNKPGGAGTPDGGGSGKAPATPPAIPGAVARPSQPAASTQQLSKDLSTRSEADQAPVENCGKPSDEPGQVLELIDPVHANDPDLVNFLGRKSKERDRRGLPKDCSPPPRTTFSDWWWDLVKRDRIAPERLDAMYSAYLDDQTYRIGKDRRLLKDASPPYPITAFVENWPHWDVIASMPVDPIRKRGFA